MLFFPILLLSLVGVDARVTFGKSEVLDNVDLKGEKATAAFRCSAGCRVFSPTKSDTIIIVDDAGKTQKSLREISEIETSNGFDLPGGNYQLKNIGLADPPFVFYSVEKGAANFDRPVVYVGTGPTSSIVIDADYVGPYTFISASGAVTFKSFYGFQAADQLPTVYATGFDSIDSCRAVFNGKFASIANTAFPVNSPIATINFKTKGTGRTVTVTSETDASSMAKDTSAVYVSPGYVGCPSVASVGDSLYTFLPRVASIYQTVYFTDTTSGGFSIVVNGYYSIAKPADAIQLSVNGDVMKLSGKDTIAKAYDGTTVNVKIDWTRNPDSKDGFALQIDISTTGLVKATTPGKGPASNPPPVSSAPGKTTPGSIEATTTSAHSLMLFVSSVVISLFLAIR